MQRPSRQAANTTSNTYQVRRQVLRTFLRRYIDRRGISCYSGIRKLKEATLYTAFKRLEEQGYIASYWGEFGSGARRRYYTITPAGREACFNLLQEWAQAKDILDKLLTVEDAK